MSFFVGSLVSIGALHFFTPLFQTPFSPDFQPPHYEQRMHQFLHTRYNIYQDVDRLKSEDVFVPTAEVIRVEDQIRQRARLNPRRYITLV